MGNTKPALPVGIISAIVSIGLIADIHPLEAVPAPARVVIAGRRSCKRDAIYSYLTAVFDLVAWWAAEDRAASRARWALQLHGLDLPTADEPFAMVIFCTSDPAKVDKRTRSKWSRVLRYAMEYKPVAEPLAGFVRRKGGINKCAARFTRCLGRRQRRDQTP